MDDLMKLWHKRMKQNKLFLVFTFLTGAWMLMGTMAYADELLWTIGTPDKSDAEFLGAPNEYTRCPQMAQYVIGESVPQKDWPFMQLGPADAWGGSCAHTNQIIFSLKEKPAENQECRLVLHFKNVHKEVPPMLELRLNGQVACKLQLKSGQGDALAQGRVKEVIGQQEEVRINSSLLNQGENFLQIANINGSWLYYDAIQFFVPGPDFALTIPSDTGESLKILKVSSSGVLLRGGDKQVYAPVELMLGYVGKPRSVEFLFNGSKAGEGDLVLGGQVIELTLPVKGRLSGTKKGTLLICAGGETLARSQISVDMPKLKQFYLFPHSHVDIGYTHRQDDVVGIQEDNMNVAIGLAEASKDAPPEARFRWNPESLWVTDHYLAEESNINKERFLEAVQNGSVSLDALYGNLLTGLCRPEELYRGVGYFSQWAQDQTGVPIQSAAICDVPGYTWGTMAMMGQAGIKYFAIAPNYSDRIGSVHAVWNDKPFYWVSQSGQEKVLCWITAHYWKHGDLEAEVLNHLKTRQTSDYPYDLEWMYWIAARSNGDCDNSPPDTHLSESVQQWNRKYIAPQLVIGTAKTFFPLFEKKYGKQLPEYSGDMTPYWEDGAASTSAETGLNRRSADKLSQAETLWAVLRLTERPAEAFREAWKNVLLYSEHTWGAYCSISKPDDPFTTSQWARKRQFALDAADQAEALLKQGAMDQGGDDSKKVQLWNTTQWPRTELVKATPAMAKQGSLVKNAANVTMPSQRLRNGDLVFLAKDVPGLSARSYEAFQGDSVPPVQGVRVEGNQLISSELIVTLDEETGAIKELRIPGDDHNFVDTQAPVRVNDYRYLKGTNPADALPNGKVTITAGETGPLVASLIVTSDAPGCVDLVREVRLVAGERRVEVINHVNRELVREKDAVHFGFAFNVPGGQVRMETPWAVVRPNKDQLPGSCYNWFTVQRWVDISNDEYGVLWAPVDAPLMQIGGITANLLGSVRLDEWMTEANESQMIYSWAQNNHWHTNYKAEQPGVTTFHYVIEVHKGGYNAAAAARFGQETTRPLVSAVPASGPEKRRIYRMPVPENENLIVETLKVSEDGQAQIYRIQNAADQTETLDISKWKRFGTIYQTDLSEKPLKTAKSKIKIPAHGILNLRVDYGQVYFDGKLW